MSRSTVSRREFLASVAVSSLAARAALPTAATSPAAGPAIRPRSDHIVVVGAGAFGGWTALALARAGQRVTLIDAWGPGNARASSGGETRVIRAVYGGVADYTELTARTLVLWREAEHHWGRRVLFPCGALWLCAADDGFVRRSIAPMRAAGLPIEELSPADAARRYPQMAFGDARRVFFEKEAGFLAARVACELVRESFVRAGGEYRQAWARPEAGDGARFNRVALSDGTAVAGDRFVFACGPWLGQMFPDVVGRRIVATRQEVHFFGTPAGDARYDAGALSAWVHLGDRITYGLPDHERRGLKVADDSAGVEVDPTTMDRVPSAAGIANARAVLRSRFPSVGDAPLLEARVCQYEASTDGHFLVDRHPQLENVWLVGGGSGHGFKMGPAIGEHVAALVQGRATVRPLFAYSRLQPRPARQ